LIGASGLPTVEFGFIQIGLAAGAMGRARLAPSRLFSPLAWLKVWLASSSAGSMAARKVQWPRLSFGKGGGLRTLSHSKDYGETSHVLASTLDRFDSDRNFLDDGLQLFPQLLSLKLSSSGSKSCPALLLNWGTDRAWRGCGSCCAAVL
jgi:hypothetical protein